MASIGELCPACFSGTLQLHEGMLVCNVCGSIHQGYAEETQEYQTGISDARFFKKSEGMRSQAGVKAESQEPPPLPPVAEAVRLYVQAVQQLLQRQARTLVDAFGMDPGLSGVLRELWLAFLAHSRLLEPTTILKLEALAEGTGAGSEGSDDDGGSDGGGGGGAGARRRVVPNQMTHGRRSARIQHEISPVLNLRHTLALLLLACWRQQEAASPLDIAHWALDGRLPYLSFAGEEGAQLLQYHNILGIDLVTPTGVPNANLLHAMAAQLSDRLGAACPPLSPTLWLQRYMAELELPQELLPVALQLHALYQPTPLHPDLAARPSRHAWALLMASVVLTVKLCFGLDGGTRSMQGAPPPAWQEWAQRQLSRLSSISAFPLSLSEASQLDEPALQSYLQYLQHGLFASFSPPSDLETVHQLFKQLALPAASSGGGSWGGATGGSGGDAPQAAHTMPAATTTTASADGLPASGLQQQPHGGAEHAAAAPQAPPAPPLQQGYHYYGAAAWRRGLFHPDYVMVLTVCATVVWLLPEALHELVCGLERGLIGAECEVSHLYHSEEQARLARVREEAAWQKQQEEELRRRRQQQKQARGT